MREGNAPTAQWVGMTPRCTRLAWTVLVVPALGCGGASGNPYSIPVGSDDAGGGSFAGSDASTAGPLDAQIQQNHVAVSVVTLKCAGDCVTVAVVASGGNPPYAFQWSDNATSPMRDVCPTATTSYSVTVTDTGSTGEVPRPAQSVEVPLTASVLACPDGGASLGSPEGQRTVVVPGIADVWLAGQPDGATLADTMGGADKAPAASPVEVPVVGASTLTFSASGGTSYTGGFCVGSSPDGGCTVLVVSQGPANGLSSLACPMNALLGVFLDATVPGGQPPMPLDASGSNAFTTLAPLLRQVFFIGDGLTGTGSGSVQQFAVPPGATRLALGSSDEIGSNYNNTGQFNVTVSSY
jgi:hypothetical protein